MATVKGVNRTLADTPTGSNIMRPGLQKGEMRMKTKIVKLKVTYEERNPPIYEELDSPENWDWNYMLDISGVNIEVIGDENA